MKIDIGDVTLFFDVDGESLVPDGAVMREKPTLLLLHGGPGPDHSTLKPFFSRFADTAQVIYLDHRGMGRSDRSDRANWTLDQWARDVKKFCDALGIEKPIVLGHSFGGFVATKYASMYPDHPSKLVISSSLARSDSDVSTDWFRELGGEPAAALFRKVFVDLESDFLQDFVREVMPLYNTTAQDPNNRSRAISNPDVSKHFFTGEYVGMDLRNDVEKIVCPTLVLAGDRDPMAPRVTADEYVGLLQNADAQYEVVEGAGHGVWRDCPEEAEAILRGFISGG